jgi:hypothetical protein
MNQPMGIKVRERFRDDLKVAMLAKNACRVSTLRLILAALKDRDIQARGEGIEGGIDETEIQKMLIRMIAQRRDSITQYEAGKRQDLADRERQEIEIIEEYLPRQLSDAETEAVVKAKIAELGASSVKDIGRTIAALRQEYGQSMDFAKAGAQVRALLTEGGGAPKAARIG